MSPSHQPQDSADNRLAVIERSLALVADQVAVLDTRLSDSFSRALPRYGPPGFASPVVCFPFPGSYPGDEISDGRSGEPVAGALLGEVFDEDPNVTGPCGTITKVFILDPGRYRLVIKVDPTSVCRVSINTRTTNPGPASPGETRVYNLTFRQPEIVNVVCESGGGTCQYGYKLIG